MARGGRTTKKKRLRLRLRLKRKPTEKKVRRLCDFCGFCSNNRYEQSPHSQEEAPVLSMESQFKRLKLLTRRMTCQDLEGLSFAELVLLETHLKDVLPIVEDQKKKVEEDQVLRTQKNEDGGLGTRRQVLVPCSNKELKKPTDTCGEGQAAPLSKTQKAASMEMKVEKLWLLKERMNGRELEGMNLAELRILVQLIRQGLGDLHDHRSSASRDQMSKKYVEGLSRQG